MIVDLGLIIYSYLAQLNYIDVLCELKQRFLHDRLMKELFYNRYVIYTRFVHKEPIVNIELDHFMTTGEETVEHRGYGDDRYMEDYELLKHSEYNIIE